MKFYLEPAALVNPDPAYIVLNSIVPTDPIPVDPDPISFKPASYDVAITPACTLFIKPVQTNHIPVDPAPAASIHVDPICLMSVNTVLVNTVLIDPDPVIMPVNHTSSVVLIVANPDLAPIDSVPIYTAPVSTIPVEPVPVEAIHVDPVSNISADSDLIATAAIIERVLTTVFGCRVHLQKGYIYSNDLAGLGLYFGLRFLRGLIRERGEFLDREQGRSHLKGGHM